MAGLPPVSLGAIVAVPFAAAWFLRKPLEQMLVLRVPENARAKRQFLLDFSLYLAAGAAVMTFNATVLGFPWIASGMKMVLGSALAGFFVALDTALVRERDVILSALQRSAGTQPPVRLYPMTRKFTLLAVTTIFLVAAVIGLVISGDVGWLSKVNETGLSVDEARDAVIFEVAFVMAVLLAWVVNLIFSYSRNLKLLFQNETEVLELVSEGDLSRLVPVATNDEFGVIAGHTNQMIHGLRHRLELVTSLQLAEDVQRDLLPQKPPKLSGFDIVGASSYCDKTGGDYYDFIPLQSDRLGVVVGDVSGHGIPSALLMTTARALLRQRSAMGGSLSGIITDVNRQFTQDVEESGRFMTLFYSEIDSRTKSITWVRAGHDPALVYDPATDSFDMLQGNGMALGVVADMEFAEHRLQLKPGQVVVIGTDGIWESRNQTGEMFGKKRFGELIRKEVSTSAGEIVRSVLDAVAEFRKPGSQDDDVTLVVIRVLNESTPVTVL